MVDIWIQLCTAEPVVELYGTPLPTTGSATALQLSEARGRVDE